MAEIIKVIILKKIKYSEADLILNTITESGAKRTFIAKSALRSVKRFGGGILEPSHFVELVVNKRSNSRQGSLDMLKEAKLINDFMYLRRDYQVLDTAFYCLDLVNKVVQEGLEDSYQIFNLLGNTIKRLELSVEHWGYFKIHFKAKLLFFLGLIAGDQEMKSLINCKISDHDTFDLSESKWQLINAQLNLENLLQ